MRENVAHTVEESHEHADKAKTEPYKPNTVGLFRLLRIMAEFVGGFNLLKKYCLAVSFFGTSRCSFDDQVYKNAWELAGRLAKDEFAVITGGAKGVMEAANWGAYDAGGESIGLNIRLPFEQGANQYLTDSKYFHYFFVRKVMLSFASEVYVFFPGGFGTMDEFFEIVTLIQTKKIQRIPVVLVGKEYWTPLLTWIQEVLYEKNHAINEEDMHIYHLVDTVDEAHNLIRSLVPIDKLKAC